MYTEETARRLELLKTARQQLNNQYIKDRATEYSTWMTDSDAAWKESGIKLPFPPPPDRPSESDIVAYALALYNAQNTPVQPAPPPATVSTPPVHIVHTVVASAPIPAPPPVIEEPVYEEPVDTPGPIAETIEPMELSSPTPATTDALIIDAVPTTETTAEPLTLSPAVEQLVMVPGAADLATGETTIKEIFNKPSSDPTLALESPPTRSVAPLIETMRKKGLLPWWVKSGDATGTKE